MTEFYRFHVLTTNHEKEEIFTCTSSRSNAKRGRESTKLELCFWDLQKSSKCKLSGEKFWKQGKRRPVSAYIFVRNLFSRNSEKSTRLAPRTMERTNSQYRRLESGDAEEERVRVYNRTSKRKRTKLIL